VSSCLCGGTLLNTLLHYYPLWFRLYRPLACSYNAAFIESERGVDASSRAAVMDERMEVKC
jgi:hypothetical protein